MSLFDLVEEQDIFSMENDTSVIDSDSSVVPFVSLLVDKNEELIQKKKKEDEEEIASFAWNVADGLLDCLSSFLSAIAPMKVAEEQSVTSEVKPEDLVVDSESVSIIQTGKDLIYSNDVSIVSEVKNQENQAATKQPTPEQLARLAEHFGK